jgi:hypothetical protein
LILIPVVVADYNEFTTLFFISTVLARKLARERGCEVTGVKK